MESFYHNITILPIFLKKFFFCIYRDILEIFVKILLNPISF